MTNEEVLLRALMGEELAEGATFHPQNNKQAYLAYAVGLLTDPDALPAPRTNEEVLLRELCVNGGTGGGVALPELLNPATAAHILAGYEAISRKGEVVVGTNDLEEQNARLEGRLSGDGSLGEDWRITDARYLFDSRARLDLMDVFLPKLGKVTSMENMFNLCTGSPQEIDLSELDTSECTSMRMAFMQCTGLKALDVSKWNTSKVKDLYMTFKYCILVEELDLSGWDTSNVTNMTGAFQGMKALKRIDLSSFDTSKASNMSAIFQESTSNTCNTLEEIIGFSATNKAGFTNLGFPYGTASAPLPLRRLTFRTDLPEGTYAIRSPINISYDAFTREGLVEMFNTLPDVSTLGLNANYTKITITGNPCVLNGMALATQSAYYSSSWDGFLSKAEKRYMGFDYSNAPVELKKGQDVVSTTIRELDQETYESYEYYRFLADTITVPEEERLSDEERTIATSKGWTLVE